MSVTIAKLGDVCKVEKGSTGIMKAVPGIYPLVVTGEERKSHSEYQFDADAVIIPLVSSTGHGHASINRLHFQTGKFALGSILCAVIPNDKSKLNAEYLFRYLSLKKDKELVSRMRGMANVTLPIKEILEVEIPVPNISDQLAFIERYKSLEAQGGQLSSESGRQLELIKQLRQQLLREAIEGRLVDQSPDDEHASVLLRKIKSDKDHLIETKKIKKEKEHIPLNEAEVPHSIPETWVWCRLGEICTKVTDGFHNVPAKLKKGRTYISATHIRDDGIRWKDCLYVSEKDHRELFNKTSPCKGEILITNRGAGCGTPAIIDIDEEFSFQNVALIGFNQNLIYSRYVYYFILKSRSEIMQTFVNGGLQPMLSNVVLRTIPIPLPPFEEQVRIAKKLEGSLQKCRELEESIASKIEYNERMLSQILSESLSFDIS